MVDGKLEELLFENESKESRENLFFSEKISGEIFENKWILNDLVLFE